MLLILCYISDDTHLICQLASNEQKISLRIAVTSPSNETDQFIIMNLNATTHHTLQLNRTRRFSKNRFQLSKKFRGLIGS